MTDTARITYTVSPGGGIRAESPIYAGEFTVEVGESFVYQREGSETPVMISVFDGDVFTVVHTDSLGFAEIELGPGVVTDLTGRNVEVTYKGERPVR